mgnify:CR=1 FL=1
MKKILELLKDQQEQIIEFGQINSNTIMLMNIKKCIEELEALEAHKRCYECKDKYECYTYRRLDEDATYILSCSYYEPKDKE